MVLITQLWPRLEGGSGFSYNRAPLPLKKKSRIRSKTTLGSGERRSYRVCKQQCERVMWQDTLLDTGGGMWVNTGKLKFLHGRDSTEQRSRLGKERVWLCRNSQVSWTSVSFSDSRTENVKTVSEACCSCCLWSDLLFLSLQLEAGSDEDRKLNLR